MKKIIIEIEMTDEQEKLFREGTLELFIRAIKLGQTLHEGKKLNFSTLD